MVTAASLAAIAGGNPGRFKSEAAFAKSMGACPIPASSGKNSRMRLNRGGNRAGNRALYQIVIARLSRDEAARAYMEKKRAEGKGKAEAIRCLKRYVAREVLALPQNQPNAPLYPAGGAPGSRPGALPHFGRPRYLGPPPRARSTAG